MSPPTNTVGSSLARAETCICPHCGFDLVKDEVLERDHFTYDPRGVVSYCGIILRLRPAHREIVGSLMKAAGRIVSKDTLLERLGSEGDDPTLMNVQVSLLRRDLRKLGIPCPIKTVWGAGFCWDGSQDYQPAHRRAAAA